MSEEAAGDPETLTGHVKHYNITKPHNVYMCVFQGHKDSAFGCVFSPGGELLVSGSEQLEEEGDEENSTEERSESWRSLNSEQDNIDDSYTNLDIT